MGHPSQLASQQESPTGSGHKSLRYLTNRAQIERLAHTRRRTGAALRDEGATLCWSRLTRQVVLESRSPSESARRGLEPHRPSDRYRQGFLETAQGGVNIELRC